MLDAYPISVSQQQRPVFNWLILCSVWVKWNVSIGVAVLGLIIREPPRPLYVTTGFVLQLEMISCCSITRLRFMATFLSPSCFPNE
jgi:hypothetical protein